MEQREPPGSGSAEPDEAEKTSSPGRPKSHRDNDGGTGLEERDYRGENRRAVRRDRRGENPHSGRRIYGDKKGGKNSSNKKINSSHKTRRLREHAGVSGSSKAISRRSANRRRTRGCVNPPRYKGMSEKGEGEEDWEKEVVPAVPRRIFKALNLLRHKKFLHVASRYLKPKKQTRKY